jgi:cytoskeleton protein RodZ
MALFSRRKDPTDAVAPPSSPAGSPAQSDVVAELRPGRRRTVGQLLRETRESFGSDIPRVAAALRIRAPFLEAIEEGHYDRLPGPVYALGFVRAYAVHLGLDGEEAVRRFKLEAEGFEAQRDLSFPVPLAERSIPGGAIVLAALMLAVCAYGLWYYLSSSARPRPEQVSPVPAELAKTLPPAPRRAVAPPSAPAEPTPTAATTTTPAAPAAAPATAENPAPPASAPAAAPSAAESTAPPPAVATTASPPSAPPAPSAVPAPVAAPPAPAAAVPAPASEPASATPAASAPPTSAAEAAPPPPPAPAQTAALPPTAGATPVPDQPHVYGLANGDTRIVIHAVSDSWIQVRDKDHKPIFTRQLHTGDSYHVPDEAGLTMKTGKGAGLAITVDGRPTPPLGGAVRNNVLLDPDRLLAGTALQQ